jgi:hypothetical protein
MHRKRRGEHRVTYPHRSSGCVQFEIDQAQRAAGQVCAVLSDRRVHPAGEIVDHRNSANRNRRRSGGMDGVQDPGDALLPQDDLLEEYGGNMRREISSSSRRLMTYMEIGGEELIAERTRQFKESVQ